MRPLDDSVWCARCLRSFHYARRHLLDVYYGRVDANILAVRDRFAQRASCARICHKGTIR
jgi:hypothetical protein